MEELCLQMEQILMKYVLPEFQSEQPFMRARACQTYDVYGERKFSDQQHVQNVVVGIYKNMTED